MKTKSSADSVNSKQSWNETNNEFTGFGGMEKQRMCDEVKLTFKLKYNYNITKMIDYNEVDCFIFNDDFYNKVTIQIKIIQFR